MNNNCSNVMFLPEHLKVPNDSNLIKFSNNVIKELMEAQIDSKHGISLVTEQPLGNDIMLNLTRPRPAAVRQYYGSDHRSLNRNVIERATYGYNNDRNPLGTDPLKYVTKPFDDNLQAIASYLNYYCALDCNF